MHNEQCGKIKVLSGELKKEIQNGIPVCRNRQLFLHHYFPALYFGVIAFTQIFDFLTARVPVLGIKNKPYINQSGAVALLAVSIAVFENNIPTSLEVFPIGSTDITNDIATGLKLPMPLAEQLKAALADMRAPRYAHEWD